MSLSIRFMSLVLLLSFALITFAEAADTKLPPITAIKDVQPNPSVFKSASRGKPIVLSSAKDAAKHFSEKELAKLAKKVDFKKQIVLVFAWRGSGQDSLKHVVMESFPEQVRFTLKRGRTRDLRPHVKLYVLRADVKWSVK
jgi:hypothetical protein